MEKGTIIIQILIRDELREHLKAKSKRAIRLKNNKNKKKSFIEYSKNK